MRGRYPLSLLTAFAASSPKGTPFGAATKLPAPTNAVPLGKVAKPQALTEGVSPPRRAFAESGAADAVPRYDPSRENAMPERPQTLRHCSIKNLFSAKHG